MTQWILSKSFYLPPIEMRKSSYDLHVIFLSKDCSGSKTQNYQNSYYKKKTKRKLFQQSFFQTSNTYVKNVIATSEWIFSHRQISLSMREDNILTIDVVFDKIKKVKQEKKIEESRKRTNIFV